MKEYVYFVYF